MFNYLYKKLGLSKKDQSKSNSIEVPLSNGKYIDIDKQFILGLAGVHFKNSLIGTRKIVVYIPNTTYSFSTYDYNYYGIIIHFLESKYNVTMSLDSQINC